VLDEEILRGATEIARVTKQGFADSYIAITAQKLRIDVATFNIKHFTKLEIGLYPFENM
jgi:predicted nucleic acid-binding protein